MSRKTLIAGNWKMNGLQSALEEARAIARSVSDASPASETLICPPATLVMELARDLRASPVAVGGQDCHAAPDGAHTGDISAEMLKDAGATYVILGHSERRADHGESNAMVRDKVNAAFRVDITPIICVGESEAERDSGQHLDVVARMLDESLPMADEPFVIAYEPVWAIGTGRAAELSDIAEMHQHLRSVLAGRSDKIAEETRLLYGGSVKPNNATEILAVDHVDGALVGGASLKASDFIQILGI